MKFLLLTLIAHHPNPVSGEKKSPADRLRDVVDSAVLAEELGFDGFAVGDVVGFGSRKIARQDDMSSGRQIQLKADHLRFPVDHA